MIIETEDLILGAGLCGLAAANVLGDSAVVLERAPRPGGLVRTECFGGFWFDQVIHVLYFRDEDTERRVRALLGDDLQPCPPTAWVDTPEGSVRFPFQQHVGGLSTDAAVKCVRDFVLAGFERHERRPEDYEDLLRRTFGTSMCETFFFPYNLKVWKRPLSSLAPDGFQWNLARPNLDEVLAGLQNPEQEIASYNSRGWYPRPAQDAKWRGMEVLSRAMAEPIPNLLLEHVVERIDLDRREVIASFEGVEKRFRWSRGCLSTLPLPTAIRLCDRVPKDLAIECDQLQWNRVYSVALSIQGPRPERTGHWRYYPSPEFSFTRLVFLHEFDEHAAPTWGWPLLVEITQPSEHPVFDLDVLAADIRQEIHRAGVLPEGCEIVDSHVLVIDPAYVVFTPENQRTMVRAREFLCSHGITPLGRYGRWEYSSMASVMRDGYRWAEDLSSVSSAVAT